VAALGGALGLFTGIAIIMLFEIMELTWDVGFNVWDRFYKTPFRPRSKVSSSNFGQFSTQKEHS
jgi:hypothetical protein